MDRRQFLKSMLAMPLLTAGCKLLGVDKMPTGNEIADLLATGEPLTAQQTQQLADFLNPVQTLSSWVKTGSTNPRFQHLETETAEFGFMPLQEASLTLVDSAQSISDDTDTALIFDAAILNDSGLKWTSGDPTKIYSASPDKDRVYMFCGTVGFAFDADGYRNVIANQFDSGDNSLGGSTLAQIAAPPDIGATVAFAYPATIAANLSYFTVTVRHTAGNALNVVFARVGIFRIF